MAKKFDRYGTQNFNKRQPSLSSKVKGLTKMLVVFWSYFAF
jgi:hypothetical protein